MYWIIIIIILIIGYLISFFLGLNKDNQELRKLPLDKKFSIIVGIINNTFFDGVGVITKIDSREFNLYEEGRNQIIKFHYSTGHLTIIWRYKYYQKEIVYERQFNNVRNLSIFEQQEIGEEMISQMLIVIENHKKNVMSSKKNIRFDKPFVDCNDGIGYLKKKEVFEDDVLYTLFERRYLNGQLWERYIIRNGERDGEWTNYNENGNLSTKISYKSGIKNGICEEYYENGQLKEKLYYLDGKLEGEGCLYFNNGKLKNKTNFISDKLLGYHYEYYKNGNLLSKSYFINDKRDGVSEVYYENGQLEEKSFYKNNLKQGHFEEYYENGYLKERGIYKDDNKCIDNRILKNNNLTEEWWNNLSPEWKKLILYNINFVPHTYNNKKYKQSINTYDTEYYSYTNVVACLKYDSTLELNETDTDEILSKVWELQRFFIQGFSGRICDLKPLSKLINLKSLNIWSSNVDYSAINSMTNLIELHLWNNKSRSSLNLISLSKLKELTLFGHRGEIISLEKLTNLTKLNVCKTIMELNLLKNLKNLNKLEISHTFDYQSDFDKWDSELISHTFDLNKLSSLISINEIVIHSLNSQIKGSVDKLSCLVNLEKIEINGFITDINFIEKLEKLIYLKISNTRTPVNSEFELGLDLNPLSNLTELKHLELELCNSNLSPIKNLIGLKELKLSGENLNLNPISKLINLEILNLNYMVDLDGIPELGGDPRGLIKFISELDEIDFSSISSLLNLRELDLSSNNIVNLELIITNLTKLEKLNLESNDIGSLDSLSNLVNLTHLNLKNNEISNLNPLSNLKNLTHLNLKNNEISNLNPLSNLKNLKEINMEERNYKFLIYDLSPISNLYNLKKIILTNRKLNTSLFSDNKKLEVEFPEYYYL